MLDGTIACMAEKPVQRGGNMPHNLSCFLIAWSRNGADDQDVPERARNADFSRVTIMNVFFAEVRALMHFLKPSQF